MPRPIKWRIISRRPDVVYFKPAGVPMRLLEEVTLTVEEAEAIRLNDYLELYQEESAKRMGVSRATFQRVLKSGKRKLADAITNGKALRIDGGYYRHEDESLNKANKEDDKNEGGYKHGRT